MTVSTAGHLSRVIQAVHLLGSECLLSGISPAVAQAMIELGLTLDIRIFPSLRSALQHVISEPHGGRRRSP